MNLLFKLVTLSAIFSYINGAIFEASVTDLQLLVDEKENITIIVKNVATSGTLNLTRSAKNIVELTPNQIPIPKSSNGSYPVLVEAVGAGHVIINGQFDGDDKVLLRVTVLKNIGLDVFSVVIGWIYFIAWSVSFYPQIYTNYKRKSVIGLNFDFLYLNIVGFTLYGVFNLGLYFSEDIKEEYFDRHPGGLNPVQVNDIVFAVHAAIVCAFTITQTFIYERAEQRVSTTARLILGFFAAVIIISVILSSCKVLEWLDFLYICSYVKLTITLIKYVPQAYMNYQRKSTVGWSIGNILLDFTGGMLSMLQMIVNAYNYDDWVSIFSDLTKFGLGLFSVAFDILFIVQHYVLYTHSRYESK